jgi:single-stranded-DNA-specific exonuclease
MNNTTDTNNSNKNQSIANKSIHPVLKRILLKRGYNSENINDFFSWNLTELPDLTQMHDLSKAGQRIIEAVEQNQLIGIYGDYDVDGTTSCALLYHFFKMIGVEVKLFQPSRFVEGYGLHKSSIDQALEHKIKVLITVDCGITAIEASDYAKSLNLDLIITDHHKDAAEFTPKAYAVVNPNRRDEPADSPLKALAGVGVAFALCLQIKNDLAKKGKNIPSIYPLLQFVAIGTICDLAKLSPMNLKMVRHGLKQLPGTDYWGLKAFLTPEEREFDFTPSEKVSFYIGPLINSKGRLEHPEKALNLLIADNRDNALLNYSHLEISNRERKFIQNEVFEEAKKQVISNLKKGNSLSAIVYHETWHEGVIGIVASKLVENFKIPAIVFTNSEEAGIIKASARTAGSLDLFECLNQCSDLFERFGGHKSAAGLSMKKENLNQFISKFNHLLSQIPEIVRTKQDEFDTAVSLTEIDLSLLQSLELLEPFGMGNPRPIFRMKDFTIDSFSILKDAHVKWVLKAKETNKKVFGISFNYISKWGELTPEELYQASQSQNITCQFSLGLNRFNGNEYIQLMIEKMMLGEQC